MKARVKKTGEIVDVKFITADSSGICYYEVDKSGCSVTEYELEFLSDEPDYWERLKHQYAGMAMQGLILTASKHMGTDQEVAQWAKEYAHALVEKMKEKEGRK